MNLDMGVSRIFAGWKFPPRHFVFVFVIFENVSNLVMREPVIYLFIYF